MIPAYAWYERQDRERAARIDMMVKEIDEIVDEIGIRDILGVGERLRGVRSQLLSLKDKT